MCLTTKRHTPRSFSTSEHASQAKVSTGLCKEHSEENQGLPFASQNLQSCHLKRRPELRKLIELFHGFPKIPVCCPPPGSIWLHYRWKSPFLSSCEWKLPQVLLLHAYSREGCAGSRPTQVLAAVCSKRRSQ